MTRRTDLGLDRMPRSLLGATIDYALQANMVNVFVHAVGRTARGGPESQRPTNKKNRTRSSERKEDTVTGNDIKAQWSRNVYSTKQQTSAV